MRIKQLRRSHEAPRNFGKAGWTVDQGREHAIDAVSQTGLLVSYPENTLNQYIVAPSLDMVPVRVNVTIPKSALEEIDVKAKKYGYTRSGFLTHAALVHECKAR